MTGSANHRPPAVRRVLWAQIRSIGVATRVERVAYLIVWALLLLMTARAALLTTDPSTPRVRIGFAAGVALPIVVSAFLLPFSVWRSDDPARRGYHLAMPIERLPHTLLKVIAGLLWVFAAVVSYLILIELMSWLTRVVGIRPTYSASWWEWLVPFSASTIAYVFGSAIVVGAKHPWRWFLSAVAFTTIAVIFAPLVGGDVLRRFAQTLWYGRLGLSAALGVDLSEVGQQASIARWLLATMLWAGSGSVLLVVAANRSVETT